MERLIFRHADLLIANTDSTAKMWRNTYPQSRHKSRTSGMDSTRKRRSARPSSMNAAIACWRMLAKFTAGVIRGFCSRHCVV
jgi:hypothetical protein